MNKRVKIAIGVVVVVVVAVVGGGYGHHLFTQWLNTQDKLPEFTEIPPGPRAPKDNAAFGLFVGRSKMADVEAWQSSRGIACNNTSMRALMEEKRQQVHKEMDEAKARGDDPDGVTGASLANYHSKKERNPQLRLACEDVDGAKIGKSSETGRVLVVLDSPDLPVRYVAFQRYIKDPDAALKSYQADVEEMTKRFGQPTGTTGGDPDAAKLAFARREWRFSDLRGEVQLMNHGARGVEVRELLEVPWPVRADAPTLP